jgi:hypothetical protein
LDRKECFKQDKEYTFQKGRNINKINIVKAAVVLKLFVLWSLYSIKNYLNPNTAKKKSRGVCAYAEGGGSLNPRCSRQHSETLCLKKKNNGS